MYDIEDNELPKYVNYNVLTKYLFSKINLNLSLPFYQLFHGNLQNEKKIDWKLCQIPDLSEEK